MLRRLAPLLLVAAGCRGVQEIPPDPAGDPALRIRVEAWDARVTGKVYARDPFGTSTPDEESAPQIRLGRDVDLGRPERTVLQLDAALLPVTEDRKRVGPRVRIRRGRWESEELLDEDLDLDTIVLPQGTPVESGLIHEFYAAGWCHQAEFTNGVRTWTTIGAAITRNTFHFDAPQGHQRSISGGGVFWLDGEVEYAPVTGVFIRAQVGLMVMPIAGSGLDAAADAGLQFGGISLTAGYRWFLVNELTLGGAVFGLTLEF